MPPVSSPDHPERQARRALIHGVYAITADEGDTTRLLADVEAALSGGIHILQYRNKHADMALKRQQLEALKGVCEQHQALLIVNDDWRLAAELGIDARSEVHLGEDDGDIEEARRALGPQSLIGVSCYASVERAWALAPVADYLAFGALFASGTKPLARPAPLSVFREVQALSLARPLVGIGGINADNIGSVLDAGADAAAVIGTRVSAAARPARGRPFDPPARWHRSPRPSAAGSLPRRRKGRPSSARHPARSDHPG